MAPAATTGPTAVGRTTPMMDIFNTPSPFQYNGHRFRTGVDDGRTCDCGHIADSLLDRWRHLYAVGALIASPNN
jgi:hypothetical protein